MKPPQKPTKNTGERRNTTLAQPFQNKSKNKGKCTLCYTIMIPGRKSAFRAGFWPGCHRESTEMGPPAGKAGRRADFGSFPVAVRPKTRPGRPIYGPEALARNIDQDNERPQQTLTDRPCPDLPWVRYDMCPARMAHVVRRSMDVATTQVPES